MSHPSIDQIRGSKAPSVTELVAETRIDAAHPAASAAAKPSLTEGVLDAGIDLEMLDRDEPMAQPPDVEAINRQVEIQARQLAEHLRTRQQELDHREAELNAREAKVESEARSVRLWMEERQAAEEVAAPLEYTVAIQDEALRKQAEALAARQKQLDAMDAAMSAERQALDKFHQQLTVERQLLDEESRAERERSAADQVRLADDIERQRREVEQRAEQTDQAKTALEQFREEVGRMHRETLEIRLATEELWAELSGTAPPAALMRSLGRIRSQLADHYRLANADLHEKKEELERLRNQLSDQYEKLVRRKRQFDKWAADCRDDVERQAARLQARSDELDRRETEMGAIARAGQAEKLELQQEVRRLRSRLLAQSQAELPV
jgi:hypothetical protein